MRNDKPRIMCVLRSGGIYDDMRYLQKLTEGIQQHFDGATLWCLSDVDVPNRIPLQYDWPGWWAKLELCRPDLEGGILFFDLDTVICGSGEDIAKVRRFTVLQHFYRQRDRNRVGSGMMYLPPEVRGQLWRRFIQNPAAHMSTCAGDQNFIEQTVFAHDKWQDVLPGQVLSYKVHCHKGLPPDARVVCYHGVPKPHDTGWATHAG